MNKTLLDTIAGGHTSVIFEKQTTTVGSIVNSAGGVICRGSVVSPVNNVVTWSGHQGLVVAPHTNLNGCVYSVAVFFNVEVDRCDFSTHAHIHQRCGLMSVQDWDDRYGLMSRENIDFLYENDLWKECPRVIFFRPDELVLTGRFRLQTLAKRIFGDQFRRFNHYTGRQSHLPLKLHLCRHSACREQATKIALLCVMGDVYPIPTCADCFKKTHGHCADQLPSLKRTSFRRED